ncbi:MAG: DUF6057 family protein, partial [Acidobacteriia bacterium]|nr:DUF6057 family protein [Terriglobia bacterium]
MSSQSPGAARMRDLAFFGVFLVYAWAGIDTRLIYHWQGPVFSTLPGFYRDFLAHPGGAAEYLYALIAQSYAFAGWGALAVAAQAAALAAVTQAYFKSAAGKALPLVCFVPPLLLLFDLNLYYDRTPLFVAVPAGLGAALGLVYLRRRWRSEAALLAAAGIAVVFFVPGAAVGQIMRRPRRPVGIAYLALGAAAPLLAERFLYVPISARTWFADTDVRRLAVLWGLYIIYALAPVGRGFHPAAAPPGGAPDRSPAGRKPRPAMLGVARILLLLFPLVALAGTAYGSYRLNARDRRLAALDYYSYREDWPAALETARGLRTGDFNTLVRYEVNLALHETDALGDDMLRFPQAPPILPDLHDDQFLPYMLKITDLCLRLGRVNEAEHYGSEAMVLGRSDPRVYRLMARVNLVKGQTAAARKFFNVLSHDLVEGHWARGFLSDMERSDPEIAEYRRRMLRTDDMIAVWQRGDKPSADTERLLLDQLEQDPSNRMAFEFLMGQYLLVRDMVSVHALMPRIKDMDGPAYRAAG